MSTPRAIISYIRKSLTDVISLQHAPCGRVSRSLYPSLYLCLFLSQNKTCIPCHNDHVNVGSWNMLTCHAVYGSIASVLPQQTTVWNLVFSTLSRLSTATRRGCVMKRDSAPNDAIV